MKIALLLLLALGLGILMLRTVHAGREMLSPGTPAPDFQLPDQQGERHELQDFAGQWLVLYFYPRDDTPGCTREACDFRDGYLEIRRMNAQVLGVSMDSTASHAEFASKYHLPFPLLADVEGQVSRAYGAFWSLGPLRFSRRHSFIIDPQGRIAATFRKVDTATHVKEVVRTLQELQSAITQQ